MVQNCDLQCLVLIDVSLMNDVMGAHPNRRVQLSNSKQATLLSSLSPVLYSAHVPAIFRIKCINHIKFTEKNSKREEWSAYSNRLANTYVII